LEIGIEDKIMNTAIVKTISTIKPSVVVLLAVLLLTSACSQVSGEVLSANQGGVDTPLPGYVANGSAPAGLTVLVNIAIPLRNTDQLSSMVKQISDPSSPSFGHFLSHQELELQFLPVADYEAMLAYLANARLSVVGKALDSVIVVQATVAQVKQFFHADVNMFTNGTCSYYMTSGASALNGAHFIASNLTTLLAQPLLQVSPESPQSSNANLMYTRTGIAATDLPEVYNATPLYQQGFQGENQTIGILDFFGSPTVTQDLQLFSSMYGLPPASLNIIPIGPYNPNLGAYTGWSTEVNLDVQMAHAMAPKAGIDLYAATGAMSVAFDIAQIINLDRISVLSMSLSFATEYYYMLYGSEWFFFNMLLPNQFFMLGSLQGITFLCSSGDAGGCGYSSGPAGNSGYPSDSPYVTSVGGTQTYFYTLPNGTKVWTQTGWSNRVYVPDNTNAGGGGGGVSFLLPKPWYQQNQQAPPSFPNGRMEPDLSLQAGINPGIYIVDNGSPRIIGGTSASAPILAGFVALIAQSTGQALGLINPFLYSIGNNASLYTKAYTPITFGYTVPWTASFGYNFVTGWGAPNIGVIASLYKTLPSQASLSVDVQLMDDSGYAPYDILPNQTILVLAEIRNENQPVTSGNFTAKLVTLAGSALNTQLVYVPSIQAWLCTLTMGQQSGVAYVDVSGASGGILGEGASETFVGYLATFQNLNPTSPYTTAGGLQVIVTSTDLDGNLAPTNPPLTMNLNSYSIIGNSFTTVDTLTMKSINDPELGLVSTANLTDPYPAGPIALMIQGSTYGFLPFMNGIYLQSTVMYPEVVAEPGVLAPGQYLTIVSTPKAPVNVASMFSYDSGGTLAEDIAAGSSITAYLVNPAGAAVAGADLSYSNSKITGALKVPAAASSGLYTVMLEASFSSSTLGLDLWGSFFGQVWVSNGTIIPKITHSPSTLYMGQTAQFTVDIRYPNGQEVTQGEYTAVIYPQQMQNQLPDITYTLYTNGSLTPLSYNPSMNRWVANVQLPSQPNTGTISSILSNSAYYAGPYEAYVTGISYDGVPTTTALSAQKSFMIQPYLYVANQTIFNFQQYSGLALTGINITTPTDLTNNLFIDTNYVHSTTVSISDSTINGTLNITGGNMTLKGVYGGNIVATNSNISLVNSDMTSLTLLNSFLTLSSSTYKTISPAAPTIQISSPTDGGNYQGDVNIAVTVTANDINSVTVYLNGLTLRTFTSNGTSNFTLQTANYPDGNYVMQVVAIQTDGIAVAQNITINLNNQISATQTNLNNLNLEQTGLQNQVNGIGQNLNSLNSGQSTLKSQLGNLGDTLSNFNSTQSNQQSQLNSIEDGVNNLNSSQSALQNQLANLGENLNQLNSTQSTTKTQLGTLGNNLTASMDSLQSQISDLQGSLKNAEVFAIVGIAVGIVGVALAIMIGLKKRETQIKPFVNNG
jgi:subtilase family serine protease